MASSDRNMENSSSNPPATVRVIARIRGFTNRERELGKSSLKPWISMKKPEGESSEAVTLSFGDQYSRYCFVLSEDLLEQLGLLTLSFLSESLLRGMREL